MKFFNTRSQINKFIFTKMYILNIYIEIIIRLYCIIISNSIFLFLRVSYQDNVFINN